jgi:hypothetical protein
MALAESIESVAIDTTDAVDTTNIIAKIKQRT